MAIAPALNVARVVLITGSTSGIGAAAAQRFAAEGDTVVFNSIRSVDAGAALVTDTPGSSYVRGDIANEDDCHRLIDTVLARHGRLDVLVNNAGITRVIPQRDLEAASVDVWREIFEVNVFGTWQLSVAAMASLTASRGAIVNVSSLAGVRQVGSSIPYSASKAAVNHMTSLLAKVVGPEVRVNAVAPGLVRTPWTKDWDAQHAFVERVAPLGRSAMPADVADVIYMLATTPFVTGQVVVVDGGFSLTV